MIQIPVVFLFWFQALATAIIPQGQKDEFRMLNERQENGGEALIPFESIENTTKATFAAIQSLKENRWVNV